MITKLAFIAGTWFGSGYVSVAPGTAASAVAILLALGLHRWLGFGQVEFAVLGVALCIPGVWAAQTVAKSIDREDPGIVVIDEVAGQWITLAGAAAFNWKSWLGAFLLFRFFDILKPPPVRQLERLHGGVGVMADDVMAGAYGAVVLYLAGGWSVY